MFTRRTLFKLLAAIGVGSLWPTQGQAGDFPSTTFCHRSSPTLFATSWDHPPTSGGSSSALSAVEQCENLLDDLDAVELIGRYVSLKPTSGDVSRLTGRCPFCRHGTDSLLVDARDDSYFCTDCLAGGHALDFYVRVEGLSLSESVRRVTRLLASGELRGKRPRLKRFHCIIDEIDRFAHESLICSREGASARGWLDQQGVTAGTAERFSFGMMSYALGKQLLARLRTMGFSPDEVERAGVDGWMCCLEDRLKAGEPDSTLLLPVRDRGGYCCGFYEQSLGPDAALTWSPHLSPYGYQLLSPHRADRTVYASSNKQKLPASVVLVERPWDVVLLAQEGLGPAVYVSPLDLHEYHDRFNRFLPQAQKALWPIHSSDLSVEFVRTLFRLSPQAVERLAFLLLSEGEGFPEWVRRQDPVVGKLRFDAALSASKVLGL